MHTGPQSTDAAPIRVVIVDDNALFRTAMRAYLESEGFEVAGEAADGDEAIAVVDRLRPHVALVDLGMPGRSGADTVAVLSRLAGETKLIVLSGSEERADVVAAERAGAEGYVVKGSDPDGVGRAIRAALAAG